MREKSVPFANVLKVTKDDGTDSLPMPNPQSLLRDAPIRQKPAPSDKTLEKNPDCATFPTRRHKWGGAQPLDSFRK
ncbi:MAG: hypothetical protein LBV28_01670 [Puniceicoccales bacterium]|jgi:hypothetical protein|nr:hypothetical protein [Puniceicoccales bacterium]